jgi:hypothetical protein
MDRERQTRPELNLGGVTFVGCAQSECQPQEASPRVRGGSSGVSGPACDDASGSGPLVGEATLDYDRRYNKNACRVRFLLPAWGMDSDYQCAPCDA